MMPACMLITTAKRSPAHTCYPTLDCVENLVKFLTGINDPTSERESSHKLIIHDTISIKINFITDEHIIAQLLDRRRVNAYNLNRHDVENICSYNASLNVHNLS